MRGSALFANALTILADANRHEAVTGRTADAASGRGMHAAIHAFLLAAAP